MLNDLEERTRDQRRDLEDAEAQFQEVHRRKTHIQAEMQQCRATIADLESECSKRRLALGET
jgi:predicted  nucleic acid-binding Zn-ribbon protein